MYVFRQLTGNVFVFYGIFLGNGKCRKGKAHSSTFTIVVKNSNVHLNNKEIIKDFFLKGKTFNISNLVPSQGLEFQPQSF